jgi:hypothetical protein
VQAEGGGAARVMEHPAADRDRRRAWAGLPALVREARHLQEFQGLEHPTRQGLQREALRLRTCQGRPKGGSSHVTTRVMGTYGYAAPEYVATGTSRLQTTPVFAHAEYREHDGA